MGKKVNCVIVGSSGEASGAVLHEFCTEEAFVICADGGLDTLNSIHYQPDLLVGDFDSVKGKLPESVETIRLPAQKDDTDMMFAVKEGFARGYRSFVLLGALGGARFDHSIGNLGVLHYIAVNGGKAMIADDHCRVFLLTNGKLGLKQMKGTIVSVFPFGCPYCTVTYHGLEYPLTCHPLYSDQPKGVSNVILDNDAEIILHDGNALIIAQF